jgi:uncharacterized membrane protein (GlpM family)
MLWWKQAIACAVVLIAVAAVRTVHAQEIALAPEFSEPTCAVSDQQVVAATERQKVTLATAACSVSLQSMVDNTLAEINSLYAAFFEQTQLDLNAREAVGLLLVRRRLLTSSWSCNQVEHYQINEDPLLLKLMRTRLQQHLTPQQLELLGTYEGTLAGRYLLQPVATRLIRVARPLSDAQWAQVLPAAQQLIDDQAKNRPSDSAHSTDNLQRCRTAHARANQRDDAVQRILARSLDEQQLEAAHAYYQDLFQRRARSLRSFEELLANNEGTVCTHPAN